MRKWLLLFVLFPFAHTLGQAYHYLSIEEGLSNRHVYGIQKDSIGYIWFLTQEGIDRFNGKEFTHYKLMDGDVELSPLLNLRWLQIDRDQTMWEIGANGSIFRYDPVYDRFIQVFHPAGEGEMADLPTSYSLGWVDDNRRIWLCAQKEILLYHTDTGKLTRVKRSVDEAINNIVQIDSTRYLVGTDIGIHHARLEGNVFKLLDSERLKEIKASVNDFYLQRRTKKLFIATSQQGVIVYDIANDTIIPCSRSSLAEIGMTRIIPFDEDELLVATGGLGVQRMNMDTYAIEPYIVNDYSSYNGMNSNSVNDIYMDGEGRIWMASYHAGITMLNNKYPTYRWIRHSIGNSQSLVNDRVNAVLEDSDGDLWMGTNNGVSVQDSRNGKWRAFQSRDNYTQGIQGHIFITLCEVSPGVIWAGGYSPDIFVIDKRSGQVNSFDPLTYTERKDIRPDKYIYSMYKDSEGYVWAGGDYNLKRVDPRTRRIRFYEGLRSLTAILEHRPGQMWISSEDGLYLLDVSTGKAREVRLPTETTHINALYQDRDGQLYIATAGSGLLVYNPEAGTFTHYHKDNSALISNNIYTILSDQDKRILLSTENTIACFYPEQKMFRNWTKDMGLMTGYYNTSSGVLRRNGMFAFGSDNGVVEFDKETKLPQGYHSKMVLSDLRVSYRNVYPGEDGSPLRQGIDQTRELRLASDQNTFSLQVSSINFDYPSNILYTWRLEGFYDNWTPPGYENRIRYTSLSSGKYTLRIRAISNEDKRVVLEERVVHIFIATSFWLTPWAMLIYAAALALVIFAAIRYLYLRKQHDVSDEKIQFFVNTAHDIRTPLTLIKAPLEEIRDKESISEGGMSNLNTALRNVHALLRLTTNLINFERTDVYSSELYLSEHELKTFMDDVCAAFVQYAGIKRIHFTHRCEFDYLSVWFDKEKMQSILQNLISNALKYTPANGDVEVLVTATAESWVLEVKDTGIGIPAAEQKKLFRLHFRGSNAINSKVTGSGTGLMLVWKLVKLHKGKIALTSVINQGTTVKVTFPLDKKLLRGSLLAAAPAAKRLVPIEFDDSLSTSGKVYDNALHERDSTRRKILVVEDNDELRDYLSHTLAEEYVVQNCSNGKDALIIVPEYNPDLVISDIMMPEMKGDELCRTLKNDINTSHIPVILLTALNSEKDILAGLNIGADEYIVKPFNIGILKATVTSLLTNRALLRGKYANLDLGDDEKEDGPNAGNFTHDMDWKFIAAVKKHVEEKLDDPDMTVDTICALMNMSRTSFYNKIKALTDQAPADYIRLIRLKRAGELLKEGKHNVTEVAEMCGFSDAKYFREVFKKHYNVSPSQYAKGETGATAREEAAGE
ncbi:MAG: response regulator [Mediterranea sp.]|nr:response regulator [Mediterranea sp.]